jgi:hypothetical protein
VGSGDKIKLKIIELVGGAISQTVEAFLTVFRIVNLRDLSSFPAIRWIYEDFNQYCDASRFKSALRIPQES